MGNLSSFLGAAEALLTWRAALDVTLIAAGLFLLYHTLRASGTWKLVFGVLLSVAVFAVARILDLRGLEWIFSNLGSVALVGLIVVFQPEIRRILERAATLRGALPTDASAGLAALLAQASFDLALKRRGALLVVPGRDGLRPWVSEGIELDAKPSLPLLLSLFDPHSPGHDGAVVVQGDRLERFSVRLPLSTSGRLPPEFGTRHHAALGLSEVTDALVVAVSEERGTVSVFSGGELWQPRSHEELSARLAAHPARAGAQTPGQEAHARSWRLAREAAFSLAAAALFWGVVVMGANRTVETAFTVPIEFTGIPATLALAGEKPTEVTIHVSGPAADLDRVVPAQAPVTIDLSTARAGRRRFPINAQALSLPRGVRLLAAEPPVIDVVLTAMVRQRLEVRAPVVGRLPAGLRLREVQVRPDKVRALVPEGGGQEELHLTTTPIDLSELKGSTVVAREIVAPPGVRPAGDSWPTVEVQLRLEAVAHPPGSRGR